MPESILSFDDALALVLRHGGSLASRSQSEAVPLLDAQDRVLGEDIVADRDFPPFPRATRDGYAVRSEDVKACPAELRVVGQIRAGGELPAGFRSLERDKAISIMTGAPVPEGADAVVMVEYTDRAGDSVRVLRGVAAGENIVPRGSESAAGALLVARGTRVCFPQVALAAAVGKSLVQVYARPRVAVLPTGDEIVEIDAQPAPNQIRNSNSFSLAAQVRRAGGEPVQLAIAPDEPKRLRELIAEGLACDLLLLSGGVSAGEYDLVEQALAEFSAEFFFTGVNIQPGKPLVFGRALRPGTNSHTYFFGLPGNPISTMVTFELFARPLIAALSGAQPERRPATLARLAEKVRAKTGLTRFLPALLHGHWNAGEVSPVKWQGSGDVAAFGRANCLLVIPPDREEFAAGEMMNVLPLA